MEEEKRIAQIEDYLAGHMSADEKLAFEKEVQSDAEFVRLFREHKYFLDGIAGMKMEAFVEKLKDKNSTATLKSTGRNRNLNSYISIAAGIIILIGISYLMMQPPGLPHLAKEYYHAPFAEVQRSGITDQDSLYQMGMTAFAAKKWDSAMSAFNQIDAAHPNHDQIIYYMAHSLAGKGDFEKALALFNNPVLNQGQYVEQASWYAILMKMYLNKPKEEILPDLRKISSDEQNFYNKKANELLNKVEK